MCNSIFVWLYVQNSSVYEHLTIYKVDFQVRKSNSTFSSASLAKNARFLLKTSSKLLMSWERTTLTNPVLTDDLLIIYVKITYLERA